MHPHPHPTPHAVHPPHEGEGLPLRDCFNVARRWKWVILACTVLLSGAFAMFLLARQPVYLASSDVLVEMNHSVVDIKDAYDVDATDFDFFPTQYRIITSRAVVSRVVDDLDLVRNPFFNPRPDDPEIPPLLHRRIEDHLIERLSVEPVPLTRIVSIRCTSANPSLARDVVNGVVSAYRDYHAEAVTGVTHGAASFLDEQFVQQKTALDVAEKQLQDYMDKSSIVSLEDERNMLVRKLAELGSALIDTGHQALEQKIRHERALALLAGPSAPEDIFRLRESAQATGLCAARDALVAELDALGLTYGPKHERVLAARKRLAGLTGRIEAEARSLADLMGKEHELTRAREQQLQETIERLKKRIQELNRHTLEYGMLQRNLQANKELHDMLLKRMKETGITGRLPRITVKVLEKAELPATPHNRVRLLHLLYFVIGSLGFSLVVAFILEHYDTSIITPDNLEQRVPLPRLGVIPNFDRSLKESKARTRLITFESPETVASEAYRSIRTSILFSPAGRAGRLFLVTSAGPAEGKSMTSANLAVTMAQSGLRVLLVDADVRKPSLHVILGGENGSGLGQILAGNGALPETGLASPVPNLDFLCAGRQPDNPSELAGSEAMRRLVEAAEGRYDKVIIDSPPILPVTDSVVLSRLVDHVILVVRSGKTSARTLARVTARLRDVEAKILGVVLNNARQHHEGYGYGYGYGYGRAYGRSKS